MTTDGQCLDFRAPEPEAPRQAATRSLTHGNIEVMNVHCFQLLSLGVVRYPATDMIHGTTPASTPWCPGPCILPCEDTVPGRGLGHTPSWGMVPHLAEHCL